MPYINQSQSNPTWEGVCKSRLSGGEEGVGASRLGALERFVDLHGAAHQYIRIERKKTQFECSLKISTKKEN